MANETIKLGLMPPLTGLVGIYGEEISRAGQIACQEINENGGVLDRELELVIEDDGSLPESAVVAAEKLVDEHHCTAIIGNLLSNSRISVAYQVAEPRKIPYLNFSFYEGSILSRYFFHFAALPNQQIDQMIPYMFKKYGPRMFFAGNNYEWPRGSIHAAKHALEQAGGEIVGEEYCPIGTSDDDIEQLLDNVAATAPDVFVPYFAGADQVNLLTQFTERGLKKSIAVVMGHYDEMMASQLSPEVREGFYSSNTYFMTVDTDENRNVLKRLSKQPGVNGVWPKGNGILTNFGEGAYVCVKAFANAANKAGSLDPEALVGALKTITLSAPQGKVQMNPEHQHARVNTFLSRCKADGKFEIIEKFGAIEPVIPDRYGHQKIKDKTSLGDDLRLQARMLEQMSDAVFLIDSQNGSILYSNRGAEKIFGYGMGELNSLTFAQLNNQSVSAAKEISLEISNTLNHKGEWKGELKNSNKDGSVIWTSVSVSSFTHPVFGEVWLAVYRDITKQKQTSIALDAALEATQLKSNFLANMSHELRTPMNSIIGFTNRVIKKSADQLDDRQLNNLRTVERNAHHLLGLINGLLDLSKIEAGKMEVHAESFEFGTLAQEVISLTQPMLDDKPVELIINLPTDEIQLHTDNVKLKQLLINLVSNAIKFTDKGSITIAAQLQNSAEQSQVVIRVTDTGTGMDEVALQYIFEAFRQVDGTLARKAGGTGLGLAIVSSFTELLGGSVSVESEKDRGTTFELIIPTCLNSGEQEGAGMQQPLILSQQEHSDDKHTILCIDDEAEALELISNYLTDEGYQVVTASSGDEGLALAKRIKPLAITLDIMMPHKDGWSVLSELKANKETENIPVVIASFMDNKALGYQLGAFDYMQKPINPDRLIGCINRLSHNNITNALVVDDDAEARDLICQILEDAKISYQTAIDGNDALAVLEHLAERPPELILLDLMMPGMDGFDLLRKMQQNPVWAAIPIIIVTAKTLEEHEREFLRPRVASILAKNGLTSEQVLKQLGVVMKRLKKQY